VTPVRPRGTPAAWFTLLVAAQAASLALIVSGKEVTYPHYAFSRMLAPPFVAASAVLVLQLAAVIWGMRGEWGALMSWIRSTIGISRFLVAGAALVMLSAVASRQPAHFAGEIVIASLLQVSALGTVVLLARALDDAATTAAGAWLVRMLGDTRPAPPAPFFDRFALLCAGAVAVTCAVLSLVVYEGVPHVPDEIVYLLQARYFAAGMLQLPAPPVPAAFDVDLIYYDAERSFSPLPPGWPAILSIGVRLGVPWLVNPVLSALAVLLLHALLQRLDSPRVARLATLLLASSPWFLFLGMSLMTHSATLACALAAGLGIAVARARSSAWPAAAAGVAVGMIGLIRPLEGLAAAVALGVWSLWARHGRIPLLPSAALTLVTILVSALVRPYNAALTGSAKTFPIMMYVDKYYAAGANDLGFGANRGMGWGGLDPWPGHGVRDVLLNTLLNGAALNLEMFAWATGSLMLVAALVASGRLRRSDWSMLAVVGLIVFLHAFYWFGGGPDFAARYWFLAIVPLVALSARAPSALWGGGTTGATRATVAVLALSASASVTWLPWRSVEKYHRFRHMSADFQSFAKGRSWSNALILVRGRRHPDYHMAALENPIDLRSNAPLQAWDRSTEVRRDVVAAYPDRSVYIVDGPTITGGGYRLVAGPLPPGSLAPEFESSADIPVVVEGAGSRGMQRRAP